MSGLIADGSRFEDRIYKEYERTVIRCSDGRPAISFHTWCFNKGIIGY